MPRGLIITLIALVATILVIGGAILSAYSTPYQVVEKDGRRTSEYQLFGVIPLPSKVEDNPSGNVRQEVIDKVRANLVLPPSLQIDKDAYIIKTTSKYGVSYWIRTKYFGDRKKDLPLLAAQLTSTSTGPDSVNGKGKDGSDVRVHFAEAFDTRTGKVAYQEWMVGIDER